MTSRGGLVNKKMTKFATMSDYLEAHHPKVYELFTYLGMQGALTPRRGGGLTLLIPDSKTVADLHKIIESDDAEKASDMLSGMVIQDNLGSEEDWKRVQDDVPTLLGKRVPVKSVTAGKIVLEGGAELTLDKGAKFLTRVGRKTRDPMSVWVVKGSFDPTSAPDATYKYVSKEGKGKKEKGGKVHGGLAAPDSIWKDNENRRYVDGVLDEIGDWLAAGGPATGKSNPAAREMAKLMNYVLLKGAETVEVAKLIQAFCRGCPLSDFLAVWKNPLGAKNFHLNEALSSALQNASEVPNVKSVYQNFLSQSFTGSDSDALTSSSAGREKLDAVVVEYLGTGLNRPGINFADKVNGACEEVELKNTINGVGPIFPKSVHVNLNANPGLFLLIEEHFYYICPRWNALRKMPGPQARKMWSELRSDIQLRFDRYAEPGKMTRMNKKEYYSAGGLTDQALLQNCVTFWRSAFMRWKPVDAVEGGFDQDEFEDPYSRELTNLRALGAAELEEIQDGEDTGLSERARLEIMAYKQRHGKLPDF